MDERINIDILSEIFPYSFEDHFGMNEQTMNKVGQITSNKLRVPTREERILRAKLILEEAMETIEALGISVEFDYNKYSFFDEGEGKYNPKEVLDGVCDMAVVANGTLLACGIASVYSEALSRVDENNWSKVKDGVIKDENGKYKKPPGYKPVILDDLIERVS
jgi:hypothetical protein